MNEFVTEALTSLAADLENEISWDRKHLSRLITETSELSMKLEKLIAERRAVLDHLEANK